MARYEHLPVYKSVYDLNLYFFNLSRGFPKEFKFGLGQEIRGLLSQLNDQIIIANNLVDKTDALKSAEMIIEQIKLKNRLLHDLNIISMKSYEFFTRGLVEISKQIEKWRLWSQKGRR